MIVVSVMVVLPSGETLEMIAVVVDKQEMHLEDVVFNLRSGTLLSNHVAAMDKHVMHLEDVVIKLRWGPTIWGVRYVVAMDK